MEIRILIAFMKKFTFVFLILIAPYFTIAQNNFFINSNAFFSKYVENGELRYSSIESNSIELNSLVKEISNYQIEDPKSQEAKAFYINAYNLLVIKGILDNYPLKSPLDVDGFFDKIKYSVAGEQLSLNDIENKKIREIFEDPRIHFALVCAAKSCPQIIPEAYMPEKLDNQLNSRTKKSLNDDDFIRIENQKVLISEIFKWYSEDFGGASNFKSFINQYRTNKIPESYSVDFYQYDWSLNEKK